MFQSVNFECELAPNTRNTRIQRHRQLVSKRIAYFRAGTSHSACQVFPFIRGLPCDMCMLSRVAFFTKELLTVNLFGEDSITLSVLPSALGTWHCSRSKKNGPASTSTQTTTATHPPKAACGTSKCTKHFPHDSRKIELFGRHTTPIITAAPDSTTVVSRFVTPQSKPPTFRQSNATLQWNIRKILCCAGTIRKAQGKEYASNDSSLVEVSPNDHSPQHSRGRPQHERN